MISNDITRQVDGGADNLPIRVTIIGDRDEEGLELPPQELKWRQARPRLAKPLCELLDACLRWVIDVDLLVSPITAVNLRTRPTITDRVFLKVQLLGQNLITVQEFEGFASLEADTMPVEGGPDYLFLNGNLQELEDEFHKACKRQPNNNQEGGN